MEGSPIQPTFDLSRLHPGLQTPDFSAQLTKERIETFAAAIEWPSHLGVPPTLPATFWQHAYPDWLADCPLPQLLIEQSFEYQQPLIPDQTYVCRIECREAHYVMSKSGKAYLSLSHRLSGDSAGRNVFHADTVLYLPAPIPAGTDFKQEGTEKTNLLSSAHQMIGEKEITTQQIRDYAYASGDTQPIHLDETAARAAGFPAVLAHGLLGMGLAGSAFVSTMRETRWICSYRMRFLAPLFASQTLCLAKARKAAGTEEKENSESIRLFGYEKLRLKPVFTAELVIR